MLSAGPDLTNVGNTSMVLNYTLYMPAWTGPGVQPRVFPVARIPDSMQVTDNLNVCMSGW